MQKAFFLSSLFLFLGCAMLKVQPPKTEPTMSAYWVRSTQTEGYFKQRLANRMQPALYKTILLQGNGIDSLTAYNTEDGQVIWKFLVSGGVEGGVAVEKDVAYFGGNDGKFYAVQAENGKLIWSFTLPSEVFSAPLVAQDRIYFLAGNNVLYSLGKEKGNLIWSYSRQAPSFFSVRGSSTPVIVGKQLYVGTADGYLVALNVSDGTLIWEKLLNTNKRFKDVDSTPLIVGEKVLVSSFDGNLYCLDIKSGQSLWKFEEGGYLPPTVIDNTVLYSTTTRKTVALDLNSGKLIWQVEMGDGIATQPVLYKGNLVIGISDGPLELRRSSDGKLLTRFFSGRGIIATPLVNEKKNRVYFISNEANLFAVNIHD
ncbi:MAG: PQQ-binding-like beta-propeller repeat protein [Pseudomonadota bacterium]|nr:PQQ-binding-like beta-propeller repeat protein [Pseudomonadota bacterium]